MSNDMLETDLQKPKTRERHCLSNVYLFIFISLFLNKFFPSQIQDLVKFGASNKIMIHQVKLLLKGKVPQKWGPYRVKDSFLIVD